MNEQVLNMFLQSTSALFSAQMKGNTKNPLSKEGNNLWEQNVFYDVSGAQLKHVKNMFSTRVKSF